MKERIARNPLKCEKTPRTHFENQGKWNYSVPPGEVFPDKWNYEASQRPLMENFESLRRNVADDEAKVQAHHDRIRKFQDTQAKLAAEPYQVTVRESARGSARSTGRSSRVNESARCENESSRFPDSETGRTGRSTTRSNAFGTSRTTARSEKDLTTYPVSSLKSLEHEHPEILAKMRAQRAAKYVTSLKNPLEPPSYNSISSRLGFFPAGTNNLHPPRDDKMKKTKGKRGDTNSSGKIIVTTRDLDTSRMKESLDSLVDELAKTDSQIARQELKIALAPKVKTYDKKGTKKK